METNENIAGKRKKRDSILNKYFKFRSSIYGQVVLIIAILSIFLFLSFEIIFRVVNKEYMESIIQQSGNDVCMLVEGSLYQYMMENDTTAMRNMLNIINKMPSIEDVNMYDRDYNLIYSSYLVDSAGQSNPNCKVCHENITTMFPRMEKSFRIINIESQCSMSQKDYDRRLLLIRSPILNQKSCYTAACHAHPENEAMLGSFVIRIPLEGLDANLNKSLMLAILSTIIVVIILMLFTRKKIKKPLHDIIKASESVSRGDKSTRLEIKPHQLNDMRMVSTAFNEMLDNLQAATNELHNWSQQLEYKVQKKTEELSEMQQELIHVERIASLGKLSSSVAHEINNPLSGILTYTKLVNRQLKKIPLDDSTKGPMMNYLKVIEDETKRCGEIVKGLLEFSRKDQKDFEPEHLHDILMNVKSLMAHQMKIAGIDFQTAFHASQDLIKCSSNQIKQACLAILLNAFEAVDENGEIIIKTSNPDDDSILLSISDNGVGISADDLPHIYEPFYSTKDKASGIGLGLAIVHGIVQNHHAKVEAVSKLGKGTTINIIFPLVKD